MEDGLRTVMKEYIDQVNDVCLRLLAGLCLKSKADFLCSRKLRWGIEYEINGTKYLLHGAGCRACDGERYPVLHCVINCDKTPAIYARAAPAKLAVGSATPSLCRHASDADIRHFIHN
ncbi:hypothetical protein DFR60_103502 [Hungatella effluvii]|uniref:Uncharacterized protein n=1 Tax=Hungatella effluvii TaxID=1096246 RepID=A0A2V3Y921_9FIRM|nr:hypothetical protein [Hungatella effluvii]PXX55444.1 hypothetical protein DFR60_103502 [Hungatella effluvii]